MKKIKKLKIDSRATKVMQATPESKKRGRGGLSVKQEVTFEQQSWLCRKCGGDCFVVCIACGHFGEEDCKLCFGSHLMNCEHCKGYGRVLSTKPILKEVSNDKY